jgi:hypothetical protein
MSEPDDISAEDVRRAQHQAQRDATPDGKKMLNATLLPDEERAPAPVPDAE